MLRKIASLGVIQLGGIITNLVRAKVFAVLLGPSGLGVVATIDQLVLSVVQIFNLSLPFTALKLLSRSHSLGGEQFRRSYAAFSKAMALLAIIAMIVTIAVIPPRLAQIDAQIALYREAVTIALLGIPATMMIILFTNVLAARQESAASVMLTAISGVVVLIAGTVGCLVGGITGIYIWVVSASTVLMIAVAIFLWKRRNLPAWADSKGAWRELTANSEIVELTFFVLIAVASNAVLLFFARYVTLIHINTESAGFLHACLAVALSIGAVLGPANALYFSPYVNRAIPAAEKFDAADRFLPRLVLLYCLGGIAVLLFPQLVLTVLFSSAFAPAAEILAWFVAWQCLYQIANVYQHLLVGLDDVRGYGYITVTGNLVAVILCLLLVNRLGLLGIALGFVVGALITLALTSVRLRSKHGLAIPKSVSTLVIFVMLGFCAVALAGQLTAEMTWIGLAARSVTAMAFLGALWLALPRALRIEISAGITKRLRR